jgi:hypothetical protein
MKPTHLIGLMGRAGTGKDTVRSILEQDFGAEGIAFADPIRSMLGALLSEHGFSTEWMYQREKKEQPIPGLGFSYRHLVQTLGTEWGRSVDPDFWLRIATARVSALTASGATIIVVSDVRFPNEADWIKQQGGELWGIVRDMAEPVRDHESEREVSTIDPDQFIDNNGTVEDLWCVVSALMHKAEGGAQ